MQYGDEYGELYGDAIAEIETHEDDALDRLVYALRGAVNLKKALSIFALRTQTIENVLRGISPEMLFDVETAYGKNLDQLGAILGLPREGWTDERYRVYLRTQSLLILPDRRTQNKLMAVIRSLMDTDSGTIGYTEFRPKSYSLNVPGDIDDVAFWRRRFLERCRPVTYNAYTIWTPDEPFGYDDSTGAATTNVFGYSDSTGAIVVGGHYSALV